MEAVQYLPVTRWSSLSAVTGISRAVIRHLVRIQVEPSRLIDETRSKGEVLTGMIFIDTGKSSLVSSMDMTKTPLAMLEEPELRPSSDALKKLMSDYRF